LRWRIGLNVLEKVLSIVEDRADHPFLIDAINDRTFTFRQFHNKACYLASKLSTLGIDRNDRVGILLNNSAEFASLYFACLYMGAVAVPLNPLLHSSELNFLVNNSGIKLLVKSPETSALVDVKTNTFELLSPSTHDDSERFIEPFRKVSPDDLFSITFTSGTTSRPKGVPHKIESLLENAISFNNHLGIGPENRFFHVFNMAYMAGFLNTLLCPFMAGASVIISRALDAKSLLSFWNPVIKYKADTFWLAPTMLTALLKVDRNRSAKEYCSTHVKTICVGTAPLPKRVKDDFEQKYGVELFESYGLSELLLVTGNSSNFGRFTGSVGRAIPNVQLAVMNESGQINENGSEGEIHIKTPYMMAGYLDYETLMPDSSTVPDWFPTGDIGYVDQVGNLFITGRKKDLIIRGGHNLSPRVIEELLLTHESVSQAAVIGVPDEFYGEEVIAVVTLKPDTVQSEAIESIKELCRSSLSSFYIPSRYEVVEELPTNSIGKIQKNRLRDQFQNRAKIISGANG
jgi:long-chain acyl-CoA synthetase